MRKTRVTVGVKLAGGAMLMAAVFVALSISSLVWVSQLGEAFNRAANVDGARQRAADQAALAISEFLSFHRGMLVRGHMNQPGTAEKYEKSSQEQAGILRTNLEKLRGTGSTEQDKTDVAAATTALDAMVAADADTWRLVQKRKNSAADRMYAERVLPAAKAAEAAASDMAQAAKRRVAEDVASGETKISRNRSITLALILICALVATGTLLMVRRSMKTIRDFTDELADNRGQISSAVTQVASSSQSLAQGASEQAASLEETSSSVEEITSMVKKNAENSQSVAGLMGDTEKLVKDGNRTLEQMVISMHEINASSDKISKIIKVIDEIAFQTNILALNAAVEAARAGEAGMGFAVVADEVRNLAQRSAQAAKDTAALIEESISKSTEGSGKLQQVTEVIRAITASSTKVKVLVDEVNLGSQEQARGIDEISKAIQQMNALTQSTAASAQQSASASKQLSAHTEAMGQVVGRLRSLVEKSDEPAPARKSASSKSAAREVPRVALKMPGPVKLSRNAIPLEDEFREI